MEYISAFYAGYVVLLCLVAFFLERTSEFKEKDNIFKFKSPLYYSYEKRDKFSNHSSIIWFGLYILLVLGAFVNELIKNHNSYCKILLNNINSIEGLVIAYAAMVMAILIFLTTLTPRDYYLTTTRMDIIKQYHLDIAFQVIGICGFSSVICTTFLQSSNLEVGNQNVFLIDIISIILLIAVGCYTTIIIGKITYSANKFEVKSLNKLYQIFWDNKVLKITSKTEDVIYVNLSYLIKRYVKLRSLKTSLKKIIEINYSEDIGYDKKWYKKASDIILIGGILSGITSIIFLLIKLRFIWLIITVILLIIEIVILRSPKIIEFNGKYVINLIMDRNGYMVKFNNKEKFIGEVSFYRNKNLEKYILGVKNLMALFYILCNYLDNDMYNKIEESFNEMMDYLKDYDRTTEKFEKALYYLPIFACGYYIFLNKKMEFPNKIIELYKSFDLSIEKESRYHNVLNGFISNVSRYRPNEKDKEAARKKVNRENYYEDYIGYMGYWQMIKGISENS